MMKFTILKWKEQISVVVTTVLLVLRKKQAMFFSKNDVKALPEALLKCPGI